MKYTTCRSWLKYGNEDDPIECTFKEWDSLDKAINYAHRYANGIKFVSVDVSDENGNLIYEISDYGGTVIDYRKKEEK